MNPHGCYILIYRKQYERYTTFNFVVITFHQYLIIYIQKNLKE